MRAGGVCTVQQTLTTEAASVLKHSLSLARRRGHAQVTPLHVAATLLSPRGSLLRRACLKSQPHSSSSPSHHPLHCRALELCFNVALNRLPTTPVPLLHGQPSLSNALIAALKRAQAHQRRGCIEQQNQQQPLLAIKVEIEQLILSILDDPSVSRVMREAGFSSPAVKNNLEDSASSSSVFQCYNTSAGGVYSSPCSPSKSDNPPTNFWHTHLFNYNSEQNPVFISPPKKIPTTQFTDLPSVKEDIKLVLEVMVGKSKRKNTVIVCDSVSMAEGVVSELMGKVERKEVPDELKSAHFIKFHFSSVPLRFMKREEVEMNLSDLKRKVEMNLSGGRVIIYTGDMKWTVDHHASEAASGYSPVDHLVTEIGRLLYEYNCSSTKVWLMATANYQTYMKCQMRNPPLEVQWGLQAVSVPSGGLGLSLHATSVHDSRMNFPHSPSQTMETKPFTNKEEHDKLSCCPECTSNYEKEAKLLKDPEKGPSPLPYWLQSHNSESSQKDELGELRRNWNRLCQSLHQGRQSRNFLRSSSFNNQSFTEKTYSYPPSSPWWANNPSNVFADTNSISFAESPLKPNPIVSSQPRFRRQNSCHIEFTFSNDKHKHLAAEPNLDCLKNSEDKEVKISLALGSSPVFLENLTEKIGERTIQHGKVCKLLQENVPWQCHGIISSIAEALVGSESTEKANWLVFEGNDSIAKRRLGRAIAESMFGSADLLFHMNISSICNKMIPCSEIFMKALRNHEKLVILVEDVDFADTQFVKFLADGYETGKFEETDTQIIVILTKGDQTSYGNGRENPSSVIQMKLQVSEPSTNDLKRKVDWELLNKSKNPKISESENPSPVAVENGKLNKQFTRQLSSNTLDLNIRADEEDDSPVSSDLTGETPTDVQNRIGFLEPIKNRFVLDSDPAPVIQTMKEVFLGKIEGCFEDLFGRENGISVTVEKMVLEEVLDSCGCFLNSLFEKWVKEVFRTTLKTVKFSGKGQMSVRLCLGGGESSLEDGFMGSNLPKQIPVSFV